MSSLPGLDLESYVMWNHDLIVDGDASANPSLAIAEAFGTIPPRLHLSKEQFKKVLAVYEHKREHIENKLNDFDEENQSWRDYAGSIIVEDEVFNTAIGYIDLFKKMAEFDAEVKKFDSIIDSIDMQPNDTVLIEFKDDCQPNLQLDLKGIDELIEKLVGIRSKMLK